jgi:gluconate 2-dehydrogenase gamma chain
MRQPTRRRLLVGVGSLGLGAVGARLWLAQGAAAPAVADRASPIEVPPTLHVLALPEYFALAAACERVFPRDGSPGAIDLGVPQYVDRALTVHPPLSWAAALRAGLARLDTDALRRFSVPFYRAKSADQDALLAAWESDADGDNATFVHNLVVATLEGALSPSTYGGNRGGAGWSSLAFPSDPFSSKPGAP